MTGKKHPKMITGLNWTINEGKIFRFLIRSWTLFHTVVEYATKKAS